MLPVTASASTPVFTAQGLVFDDRSSSYTVAFGSEDFAASLAAGRYNKDHDTTALNAKDITAEYYRVRLDYAPSEQLALNAGYTALKNVEEYDVDANIWHVGGSYAFDKNVKLVAEYAQEY